jgi:hypothetical protein
VIGEGTGSVLVDRAREVGQGTRIHIHLLVGLPGPKPCMHPGQAMLCPACRPRKRRFVLQDVSSRSSQVKQLASVEGSNTQCIVVRPPKLSLVRFLVKSCTQYMYRQHESTLQATQHVVPPAGLNLGYAPTDLPSAVHGP